MIIGSAYIYRETTDSTNALAQLLLKESKPAEGTIIHAGLQLAGKGQKGKTWLSDRGKNLLFSIILYPVMIQPEDQFILSMVISLGICDFVNRYVKGTRIKWPNDIYAGDDKIAGILIENSILGNTIENCVAGIGLNINQDDFHGGAPNPVSLKMLTGQEYNTDTCLKMLASDLDRRYRQMLDGKQEMLRKDYISSLYLLEEDHMFTTPSGALHGRIKSVDNSGRLLIEDEAGKITAFSFREIEFTS